MRRLPVYLLVDTSGSMRGEPIIAANNGLQSMISTLKQDPVAMESVHVCVVSFDREVKEVLPLTALNVLQPPVLSTPDSGPTLMGKALEALMRMIDRDAAGAGPEGDWLPLLFVITDGKPSDTALYRKMTERIKGYGFAEIVACAAGPDARTEPLKMLTEHIYALSTMDGASFVLFFKWVSESISRRTATGADPSDDMVLPAPPAELTMFF